MVNIQSKKEQGKVKQGNYAGRNSHNSSVQSRNASKKNGRTKNNYSSIFKNNNTMGNAAPVQ
jgi:hypothetical protein